MSTGIYKRGTTWTYRAELPKDPATGERRIVRLGGFRTKKEAEASRAEAVAAAGAGTYVAPNKLTLGRYLLERWLPAQEARGLRPTALESYRVLTTAYVVPRLGHVVLSQVDGPSLTTFYGWLASDGRRQGAGGLAPKSIRNVDGMLNKAFNDAVRWNLLARNPAAAADPPRRGEVEMRTWSAEQLERFVHTIEGDRLRGLWILEAFTGMRRGELVGLRWGDVDLDAGRVAVRQAVTVVTAPEGKRLVMGPPKTSKGRRTLALDEGTLAALRRHRADQAAERLAAGPAWRDEGLVFAQQDGTMLHPQWLTRRFNQVVVEAGLPRIRLHDVRHTYASVLLQAGVPLKVVSERIGHAQATVTLNVYAHVLPGADADAAALGASVIRASAAR